jgi:outer membrane receptor protein involved in Fe transport
MKYSLVFLFIALALNSVCQRTDNNFSGQITGYVYEDKSKQPIEFANVVIYNANDSSIVSGSITDKKGYFKIDKLRPGTYFAEIMFLGYSNHFIPKFNINPNKININLNKIYLKIDAEILGEAVVEAQVNDVEYKLDRKVINVNHDVLSSGATAVEALENVPSVTTDIDGNVSLRGTESFLVLIDGRPSPLQGSEALQQIPASSIANIEIITNPSAKYEAEGVGGIINVVLQKERRRGYNGQVAANYGSFNSFGTNALFNFRSNKFNFFVGGEYNSRNGEGKSESRRETYLANGDTFYLFNNSENNRNGGFGSARLGADYYINDNEIITVSAKYGQYKRNNIGNAWVSSFYQDVNDAKYNEYYYLTENTFNLGGGYFMGDVNYAKKFRKEGHEIQAYISYSTDFEDEINQYLKNDTDVDWNEIIDDSEQYRTTTDYSGDIITSKIDYVLPLFEKGKLEAGWQMRYSDNDNEYKYQSLISDNWIDDPTKFNPYIFSNNVQSGYALYSDYLKNFGYQVGFRTEYTDRVFDPTLSDKKYEYNKFDFFPSLHVSYQMPADMQIMASYSRRLRRPAGYFLDPFEEIVDPNNIRRGNPELEPEYTNSYDVNFQKKFGTHFISVEAYSRQTNNKMERIVIVHPEYDSINLSTHANIGRDLAIGSEIMANINIFKWWNFNASGNVYYYEIISDEYNNNNTVTWRGRINNTFRIPKSNTVIQFGGHYSAPSITSQGKRYGSFMANLGVRQDFMDKKLSVSFNLRDLFRTGKWKNETLTDQLYSYSVSYRKSPSFNISLTYRINDFKVRKEKSENMEYSGDDDM